jgi:hypothetical protein
MPRRRDPATCIPPFYHLHAGNLEAFYAAVKRGELPFGCILHVESLGKLSRDKDRALTIVRDLLDCNFLVHIEDRDLLLYDPDVDLHDLLA